MGKTKIFVSKVLPCAGDLEVAIVLMDDGATSKEVQLCVPKSCNISSCIGEEVYYECRNGRVYLRAIQKPSTAVALQDYEAEGE